MPAEQHKARELFLHAVGKLSPEQWDGYVVEACGEDAELARQVGRLLQVHRDAGSFLDRPAAAVVATGVFTLSPGDGPASGLGRERPGTVIGPYKLLQVIGEGGMGTVWMAEQTEPVKRKVALKVIKPGMDSQQVIARFEAERQALALMDHVNIARVFDGGTTSSGLPYFVMELVNGVPITRYCDDNRLTPRQRLELFVPVCQAIQHAHQKGVIHRDVKPSNVMVTLYDGRPVPKVIDFGVAKATEQKLTERTLFTQYGTMVGTLEYMSPEQAELSALGVDTRSDVYSLGVLLYELLTGSTPLGRKRVKEAGYPEVLRLIKEEEPQKPSNRLSDSGEALASISANRHTEPAKLSKLMRGELDWIVMKCLEKDRNRRYETANGFAADVQRYLADEPVLACPPSSWYRLGKFARRNKAVLVTAALLAFALLVTVGAVAGALGDRAARQAAVEQEARRTLDEAEGWLEQGKWSEALAVVKHGGGLLAGGGSDELRDRLQRLRKDLEMVLRVEDLGLLAAEIKNNRPDWDVVDQGYAKAFADYGIDVLNLPVEEAAARIRARGRLAIPLAVTLDDWASTESSRTEADRARIRAVAGAVDPDPWRRQVRKAVQKRDGKALAELAGSPKLAQQPRTSLVVLKHGLRFHGLSEKSLAVLRMLQRQYPGDFWVNYWLAHELNLSPHADRGEAVSFARAALAIRPKSPAAHLLVANTLLNEEKLDEAIVYYRKAIELAPNYAYAHNDFGWALYRQSKLDEAIAAFRKAIELDPKYARAYNNLGTALRGQNKVDDAIAAYRKSIELDPKDGGYNNLGTALRGQNKVDDAIAAYRKAIAIDPKNAYGHHGLGLALAGQNRLDEAIVYYRKAIAIDPKSAVAAFRKAIELDPKNAYGHHGLGLALAGQNRLDEAIVYYRKAIELAPNYAYAHNDFGWALYRQSKLDEAIAAFRKAIELDPKYAGAHINLARLLTNCREAKLRDPAEGLKVARKAVGLAPQSASAWQVLGWAHYRAGDWTASIAALEKSSALQAYPKGGDAFQWFFLAMAHWKLGEKGKAREWYDRAVESADKHSPKNENARRFRAEAAELLELNEKK